MQVTCTANREMPDGTPGRNGEERTKGCGATFEIDDAGPWDVKTNAVGDVVSRHRGVECPACQAVTFVVEGTQS